MKKAMMVFEWLAILSCFGFSVKHQVDGNTETSLLSLLVLLVGFFVSEIIRRHHFFIWWNSKSLIKLLAQAKSLERNKDRFETVYKPHEKQNDQMENWSGFWHQGFLLCSFWYLFLLSTARLEPMGIWTLPIKYLAVVLPVVSISLWLHETAKIMSQLKFESISEQIKNKATAIVFSGAMKKNEHT